MTRKLRVEFAGACYHVINRGNYRRDLFTTKGAAEAFERCLAEAAERFHWLVHAFVVMSNHFHLALETPEPNLSEAMKWLQGTWAARFNRFRGEIGRPFQGRYKALHVEPGEALAEVAHYIHLNPVRAGILPTERLLEYPYSSLPRFLGPNRPAWLIADTILTSVSNTWLAQRLQMGVPGSVTQYVRRFRLQGGVSQRDLKMVVSRIHT